MDQNKVLYALENRCLYLKMIGSIRHTVCTNLDSIVRQVIDQDQVDQFVVDLRSAVFLDSTSLGIIARMARYMKKSSEKPVLISTNDDVNEILNSIRFNSIAQIVKGSEYFPEKLFDSDLYTEQIRPHHDIILESHHELTKIHKNNKNKFDAVIKSLENDQDKKD